MSSQCPVCKAGNPRPGHWPHPVNEEVICDFHMDVIRHHAIEHFDEIPWAVPEEAKTKRLEWAARPSGVVGPAQET